MSSPRLLLLRTARKLSRGGFTLVELLVVIGIIAILAGVALGPITSGIKKAKQSTGMQTARTLAVAEFSFSNDNNGSYPDTAVPVGNTGTAAAAVALPLISGSYISDPSVFYISGSSYAKYSGTAPLTGLTAAAISWDFCGTTSGSGINSNAPDALPIVWSSLAGTGATEPTLTSSGTAITGVPGPSSPYTTQGVAVAFKSNSAKFIIANGATPTCTFYDATYPGYTTANVLKGGG